MAYQLLLIGLLRGLWPLMYFVLHPFAVHYGASFTDMIDHKVIGWLGYDKEFYARWDSAFDIMYICSMIVYLILRYWHVWQWRVVIALAVYRVIGGILFCVLRQHWIPVVFPAAAGWLMLIMTTLDIIGLPYAIMPRRRFVPLVVVVFVLKVVYEVMHHLVFYTTVALVPAPPSAGPFDLWLDEAYVLYAAMLGLLVAIGLLKGPHGWRFWLWRSLNAPCLAPCKNGRKKITPDEAVWCARMLRVDLNAMGLEQWGKGMNVELEHGWTTGQTNVTNDDLLKTGQIALAHFLESPDYYKDLENMEKAYDEMYKDRPRPRVARWQQRSKQLDV